MMFSSILDKSLRNAFAVLALFIALGFLFISCDSLFDDSSDDKDKGETETFFALDNRDTPVKVYSLKATKLVDGAYCAVWMERNGKVTQETAEAIAGEFDNLIFPKTTGAFGQSAQYRLEGGRKLDILLLDIRDTYGANSTSYIAGYFSQNDISQIHSDYSNNRAMIYMDINPGLSSIGPSSMKRLYTTMTHEFTHFLTYTIGLETRSNVTFTTWIDEGLSAAAEYLYTGGDTDNKVGYFNAVNRYYLEKREFYGKSRITQGNNFFTWENDEYILDEYSTAYLFFQWLYIQAGTAGIFRDIITAPYADHRAVTYAAKTHIAPGLDSWEKLLETWLWANRLNRETGLYGYKGRLVLATAGVSTTSINLKPGEGVYSNLSGTQFLPSPSFEISYSGMSAKGDLIEKMWPPYSDGDTLLTFNGRDSLRTAALSGKGDPWIAASTSGGRSAAEDLLLRPFPIDRVFHDYDIIIPQSQMDSGASQ